MRPNRSTASRPDGGADRDEPVRADKRHPRGAASDAPSAVRTTATIRAWRRMNSQQGGDPARFAAATSRSPNSILRRFGSSPESMQSRRWNRGQTICSPRSTIIAHCHHARVRPRRRLTNAPSGLSPELDLFGRDELRGGRPVEQYRENQCGQDRGDQSQRGVRGSGADPYRQLGVGRVPSAVQEQSGLLES